MAEAAARQQRLKAIDLVLSCSVCQDTLSAIYATPDSRHGLQQSPYTSNGLTNDGAITKLWLTECAHITCGKHLEGGGVPFHPQDQPPKATCPYCSTHNRDQSAKILYAIRGISEGEYDENIPKEYLRVPPPQLGQPGNEALRFQYVSLLRFASNVHERLLVSEKQLNTWKERESSIVACLAATEPLGRALHIARDQLLRLHGDVSVVDDALHLAASLRGGTAGDAGKQSVSTTDGSHTVLGDQGPPAKSLLARGSAADLQIIQDHVRHPNDQELSQTAQTHGSDGNRPSKRKRLETISEFEIHQQRSPNVDGMLQRRSSRDEMPPPTQLLHDTTWTNLNQPVVARRYQSINQVPGGHDRSDSTHLDNDYTLSNNGSAGYSFRNVPEERPCGEFASVASPAPNYPRNRQFDDGELDRDFRFTAPSRLESRLSGVSPNRLTLPPSTPSVVSHRFPRRIGLSANVRTSKPPLPTPENSRSPERRVGYRPTTQTNAAPAASPYFRSRTLTTSQMVTSPFINRPSQPMAPPNPRSYTSCNNPPMHTPAASTPWKLSWLTAPYKRDQSDTPGRRQGSSTEQRLQNGSGAYRHPGGHQNANNDDRRPSNNSFSFTDQPRINSTDGGRSSRAAFASHGRRPARR